MIRQGEHDRLITRRFAADPAPPAPRIPAGAWVVGGLGAAGLTAGAVLWGAGRSEPAALHATCGISHTYDGAAIHRARSKLVAGDIVFGLGLAAMGAAGWWGVAGSSAPKLPVSATPAAGGGLVS